ncbi:hypothetical protein IMCC3317_02210 [Kordia antarctica]|uniref:Bacteriocin n=1 Tax=Kordia antarctica TaxID=1218801 RepID=A0A7L4ZF97_9FLAO|nr:hypothetical protein IMCC3317_02210 [Kordia antarctica]
MLKNISNLGSVLNKSEQKSINGGKAKCTLNYLWCPPGCVCYVDQVNCVLVQKCDTNSSSS